MVRGMTEASGDGTPGSSRVVLRAIAAGDRDEFLGLARASVGLHHPWYAMPMTPDEFRSYLARYDRPTTEGFLVCQRDGGAIAGTVTVDSIVRGRFQPATLSYAAFAPAARVPPGGLLPCHAVHRRRLAGPRALGDNPRDD
jgi:hypothetical protein